MIGWLFGSRIGQGILIGLVVVAALFGFRLKSIQDGVERERQAQAERNRRTKEQADAARDDALGSDDPKRDLLRDFRRSDGQ